MKNKIFTYKTVLVNGPFKGVYAEFPFDSVKEFGTKKHVWSKVNIEGKDTTMNLLPNGQGGHWLHFKKEILAEVNKQEGDTVQIELQKNDEPRTIDIPDYLQWLLDDDPQMARYFNRLPISGKKFWIQHIEEPKNEDTKVERINRLFMYLQEQYARKS